MDRKTGPSNYRGVSELDRRIGQEVRDRRRRCGMTQEQLSAALGVTYQQVQKYEGGSNRLSASWLHLVCEALQVPVTEFYQAIHKARATTDAANITAASAGSEADLVEAFRAIENPLDRGRVIALAQALGKKRPRFR